MHQHKQRCALAADPAFFRECSTHINGNFTVQNLVEVIARIHNLLSTLSPQAAQQYFAVEKFKRAFRGLDPFGELPAHVGGVHSLSLLRLLLLLRTCLCRGRAHFLSWLRLLLLLSWTYIRQGVAGRSRHSQSWLKMKAEEKRIFCHLCATFSPACTQACFYTRCCPWQVS